MLIILEGNINTLTLKKQITYKRFNDILKNVLA